MQAELNPNRNRFITASEIGGMLGLYPQGGAWPSPEECIRRKQANVPDPAVADKDAVVCGKYLEPLLIRLLREKQKEENMGLPVGEFQAWDQKHMVTNDRYPWLSATPDVIYRDKGVAIFNELKTTSQDYSDLSDMPAWHLQVVCQLMASGLTVSQGVLCVFHVPREMQFALAQRSRIGAPLSASEDLVCDFLRSSLRRFPVALSVELAGVVDEMGRELHQRFIVSREDPKGWKPDTKRILDALYPAGSGAPKALTLEEERDVRDLMAMKRTHSDLEVRIKVLREKVIGHLGGASKGLLSDGTAVTYSKTFTAGYTKEVAPSFSYRLNPPRTKAGD